MTIYAWARARAFPTLPRETRLFDVAPETRVSADCYWQPRRSERPLLLALHGLEGSSEAHYMRGLACKAFAAGFSVVLLNQRNCGGTEHLCPGLYHSGLTEDPAAVIAELCSADGIDRIAVAGYSLGGNLALKLAGDFGTNAPRALRAVCAVSPIIEVSQCVHALERRQNLVYQWNFVKDLKARMRRKARSFPGAFAVQKLASVRTVRTFDDVYTAPHFGFRDAEDYYHRVSAMRVIDRIQVPTLIITAADDPFVPAEMFESPAVRGNPNIATVVTRHGGHCGFVADPRASPGNGDPYWAETSAVRFALGFC
jgi:uncharacterized protein